MVKRDETDFLLNLQNKYFNDFLAIEYDDVQNLNKAVKVRLFAAGKNRKDLREIVDTRTTKYNNADRIVIVAGSGVYTDIIGPVSLVKKR